MENKKLLIFGVFALSALSLTGCETCPNAVQYADIGIRISPMACVTKSTDEVKVVKQAITENND